MKIHQTVGETISQLKFLASTYTNYFDFLKACNEDGMLEIDPNTAQVLLHLVTEQPVQQQDGPDYEDGQDKNHYGIAAAIRARGQ